RTVRPEEGRIMITLLQRLQRFESGLRYHFDNPPETWSVRKAADRSWHIVNRAGDALDRFTTRRAAEEDLANGGGRYGRIWRERDDWYRGTSRDPRNRKFTDDEQQIIDRVFASYKVDPHGDGVWQTAPNYDEPGHFF